jgi:hypothetical protein
MLDARQHFSSISANNNNKIIIIIITTTTTTTTTTTIIIIIIITITMRSGVLQVTADPSGESGSGPGWVGPSDPVQPPPSRWPQIRAVEWVTEFQSLRALGGSERLERIVKHCRFR